MLAIDKDVILTADEIMSGATELTVGDAPAKAIEYQWRRGSVRSFWKIISIKRGNVFWSIQYNTFLTVKEFRDLEQSGLSKFLESVSFHY